MTKKIEVVKGFKATDKDMICSPIGNKFQYELGKEYKEDNAKLCDKGFHFCENPLDILNYYNLCDSRFFEVEAKAVSDEKSSDDTKRVSKRIKLTTEIGIPGLIKAGFDYIKEQCDFDKSELLNEKKIINNDDYSKVATSGDDSKVATSGDDSQVATSGNYSKVATSGNYSKVATSGYNSQVATSGNYSKVATSGDDSKVATSGYNSQVATSGNYSKVAIDGEYSVGMCAGINSQIKGKKGNWITLAEWEYDNNLRKYIPICVKSAQIDGQVIKENTYYKLKNGEFVEC